MNNIYEPTGSVGEAYALSIAASVRAKADERRLVCERRRFAARGVWPNDFGGYFRAESRVEKPCKPLEPRERFARLQAAYLSMADLIAPRRRSQRSRRKFRMTRLLGRPTPIPV